MTAYPRPPATNAGLGERIDFWWRGYGSPACLSLGGFLLGLCGILVSVFGAATSPLVIIGCAGALVWTIGFIAMFQKPSYSDISRELAETRDRADRLERTVADSLKRHSVAALESIGLHDDETRVSIYVHREGRMHLIARHSRSPVLTQLGRSAFPVDQGVIGKAWANQIGIERDLPADEGAWVEEHVDRGFDRAIAKEMKMRARSIGVIRTYTENYSRALGVLVVESKRPRGINKKQLIKLQGSREFDLLCREVNEAKSSLREAHERQD